VLKVLELEGIPIDLIVGTSMGALVGAAYAFEPDATALERRVLRFFSHESEQKALKLLEKLRWHDAEKSDLIHRLAHIAEKELALSLILVRKSLLSEKEMRRILRAILPDIGLGDTRIAFAATAVDLVSGREVVLSQGSLIHAVMASCAVPGFMPAVTWDKMVLVDGGVVGALPCGPARDRGAGIVIGVDVGVCLCRPHTIGNALDEIQRVTQIMGFYLNKQLREKADVLIEPGINQTEWTDFLKYRELIREGEKAAVSKIEEIREILSHRFRRKVFQRAREILFGPNKGRREGKFVRALKLWFACESGRSNKQKGKCMFSVGLMSRARIRNNLS
jgi:NTE family protein